jgi:hypothetical protein
LLVPVASQTEVLTQLPLSPRQLAALPSRTTFSLLIAGTVALGDGISELFGPDPGNISFQNLAVTLPASAPRIVEIVALMPSSLPGHDAGLRLGASYQLVLRDPATLQPIEPTEPLSLTYSFGADDVRLAGGDETLLRLAIWDGTQWQPLPCTIAAALSCTTTNLGVLAVVAPGGSATLPLDFDIVGGHFYKQANGFSGRGETGYAVVDDTDASFWTELQRLGGLERVGYPVSNRFMYQGALTQAFQKLVLQWRPQLGQAVPVNVLDDLSRLGADTWLSSARQVPPASSLGDESGLSWDQLVARHLQLVAAYPALDNFVAANPSLLDIYGLPVAVQDYGPVVSVRLQRATLQWLKSSDPAAPDSGPVVIGNGGDLGKEAGLVPLPATPAKRVEIPSAPPEAAVPADLP